MVERQKDSHAEAQFLRSIRDGEIELVDLLPEDIDRIAQLVDKYADFPLGAVDASVVAVAERLRVNQIATLDRRHFAAVKPQHGMVFELLPH